ncbi:chromophore lyase CpcT/CpeT [Microcoleus sp. herbarium19]|uniref:chromophore lyase CpcT/CpeT n=1 Tax=unclassified Microcoleus TaxID=2642155 RepID=UPI002FD1C92E
MTSELIALASLMAGHFSNQKQASANPQSYAHIRVLFRPLPFEFFGGIGFYSEQVYDYDVWNPYRQGIHRLVEQENQIYIENYGLKDGMMYAGAGRELDILMTITPDSIERRYNCSMIFKRDGEMFRGSVEPGNKCLINRKGCETYLVSDVELTEHTWASLDRGMDVNTGEQVWGSTEGPLLFEKVESFASELPKVMMVT